jgi:hypothetical protein
MSEREIQAIANTIRKNAKKSSSNAVQNTAFLKKVGILTKGGNVSKAYLKICTPTEQV